MFKYFLTAILVAMLPMSALAVTANVDRSTTPTLTYTIRARDTSPTTILSMGGAGECSIQLQSNGATLQVAPRADAAVPHSTAMGDAAAVSTAVTGSHTFTSSAGQFSVAFTAADNSSASIICNPTGGQGATDGVDVLIGGENGVTDQANPNSPVIVCPQTNAACMYLSSTTGWWSAVSSDGVSTTSWGSESEQVIYGYEMNPVVAWDAATTYNPASTCIKQRMQFFNSVVGACSENEFHLAWMQDVTITSISASPELLQNGSRGCDFKLVEALTGTDVANAEILFPASNTSIAAGEVVSVNVGTKIDAGTRYALMYQDGSFCDAGSSCNCGSGAGGLWLEIRGIIH